VPRFYRSQLAQPDVQIKVYIAHYSRNEQACDTWYAIEQTQDALDPFGTPFSGASGLLADGRRLRRGAYPMAGKYLTRHFLLEREIIAVNFAGIARTACVRRCCRLVRRTQSSSWSP